MIYKIFTAGLPEMPPEIDDIFENIIEAKQHVRKLHLRKKKGIWVEVTTDDDEQLKVIEDLQEEGWL
tara:strand:+ start:456 stop:656 length:201 start_codon:yes stop_codon:yes gene_type:complete